MKNVEEIVRKIVAKQLNLEADELPMEGVFGIDIEMDSVDAIQIVLLIEEKFNILIPEEKVKDLSTPRKAIDFIKLTI